MICRSCGAEIADKAIVCYRCGTPTAAPIASGPAGRLRSRRAKNWPAVIVMAVILVLGAWLIPKTTPGSIERIAAWVATWLVVIAAFALLRRRS